MHHFVDRQQGKRKDVFPIKLVLLRKQQAQELPSIERLHIPCWAKQKVKRG